MVIWTPRAYFKPYQYPVSEILKKTRMEGSIDNSGLRKKSGALWECRSAK